MPANKAYRTLTFELLGGIFKPFLPYPVSEEDWHSHAGASDFRILSQALVDLTYSFWEAMGLLKNNLGRIRFKDAVRDESGQVIVNKDGKPRLFWLDVTYLVPQIKEVVGLYEPQFYSSNVMTGLWQDAAEQLKSWFRLNESARKEGKKLPRFPEPEAKSKQPLLIPLNFAQGSQVRLLQNERGRYFVALPLLSRNNPLYHAGSRPNLRAVDGGGKPKGGQLYVPINHQKSGKYQLDELCRELNIGKSRIKMAQIVPELTRVSSERRLLGKPGSMQTVLKLHLVVEYSVKTLYKPRTLAGVAFSIKNVAAITVTDRSGNVIAEKYWAADKLKELVAREKGLESRKEFLARRAYGRKTKNELFRTMLEAAEFLKTHKAKVNLEPVEKGKHPVSTFQSQYWPYRKEFNILSHLLTKHGLPWREAENPWYVYASTCSNCGASNIGKKEEAEKPVEVKAHTFLCSSDLGCGVRKEADANTSLNLAKELQGQP